MYQYPALPIGSVVVYVCLQVSSLKKCVRVGCVQGAARCQGGVHRWLCWCRVCVRAAKLKLSARHVTLSVLVCKLVVSYICMMG